MTNKKTDQKIVSQGQAPIKWNIPEDITTHFASHMIVQQIEDYFKLSFFEVKPKIKLIDPDAPEKEVKADCVASIIVTPFKLQAIVKVLDEQFKLFKEKVEANLAEPSEHEQPS
jgi:hypothetical protein